MPRAWHLEKLGRIRNLTFTPGFTPHIAGSDLPLLRHSNRQGRLRGGLDTRLSLHIPCPSIPRNRGISRGSPTNDCHKENMWLSIFTVRNLGCRSVRFRSNSFQFSTPRIWTLKRDRWNLCCAIHPTRWGGPWGDQQCAQQWWRVGESQRCPLGDALRMQSYGNLSHLHLQMTYVIYRFNSLIFRG